MPSVINDIAWLDLRRWWLRLKRPELPEMLKSRYYQHLTVLQAEFDAWRELWLGSLSIYLDVRRRFLQSISDRFLQAHSLPLCP
jgi:hypothetical protein